MFAYDFRGLDLWRLGWAYELRQYSGLNLKRRKENWAKREGRDETKNKITGEFGPICSKHSIHSIKISTSE
jgi:hypothetical protein